MRKVNSESEPQGSKEALSLWSMGLQALYRRISSVNSDPVTTLYSCVAAALGFEGSMETSSSNLSVSKCMNNSCYNSVSQFLIGR